VVDPGAPARQQGAHLVLGRGPTQAGQHGGSSARAAAPVAVAAQCSMADRSRNDSPPLGTGPLEGEADRHDVPAPVDLADAHAVVHPHVGVEGQVGPLARDGVHGSDLDAGLLERHQEGGQPLVLGHLGVGPGEHEGVVRLLGVGGEHLLAVDDPLVAVAHGAGLRRRHVGPDSGSVKPSTMMISPRSAGGRMSFFCSSVPMCRMTPAIMRVVPTP
jgi:hypothetical protein